MPSGLPTHLLCVWVDKVSCKGLRRFIYCNDSSTVQRSSLKQGTKRSMGTFVHKMVTGLFFLFGEVMGRSHMKAAALNTVLHKSKLITAIFPGFV